MFRHQQGDYPYTLNCNFPEETLILISFCCSVSHVWTLWVDSQESQLGIGITKIFPLIILNTDSSSVFVKPEWSAKIQATCSYNARGVVDGLYGTCCGRFLMFFAAIIPNTGRIYVKSTKWKYDDGVNLKNVYIRCDADTGWYDPPSVVPGHVSVKIF